ncbi:MAG: chromosome segregation protein SMC, partial [Candidatus Lokiarchaeota archaeon]|nr:chromosome segregation protein SMC [Candidatus Lokiarchaeota archaeon]
YLALTERLMEGKVDFTCLDDVVMSVDAGHRRGICKLLKSVLPNRQFLITTHDKTWANQLRVEDIVSNKGFIEFYKWDIDSGPYVNLETDLWDKIDAFIDANEISNAAGLLRRGSEQFFSYVCHNLDVKVKYLLDGNHSLGDLLPPAVSKLRKLLKEAKSSAQSWSKQNEFDEIQKFDSTVEQIYKRTDGEKWIVNPSIHYNNWSNFQKEDFIPVRESFQDLFGVFLCQNCGSIIGLAKKDYFPISVTCDCGDINLKLIKKENA